MSNQPPICCPSRSEDPRQAAARQSEIMRAFAEGNTIEVRYNGVGNSDWELTLGPSWDWRQYDYRVKVSPVAPGHNPDGLTVEQVGQGFRLLTTEEVAHQAKLYETAPCGTGVDGVSLWFVFDKTWSGVGACGFARPTDNATYRTTHAVGHYLPKVAEGHNPDKLNETQVGVNQGWRLLSGQEKQYLTLNPLSLTYDMQVWLGIGGGGWGGDSVTGADAGSTYRTKKPSGFYLPKPKLAAGHNPFELTETEVEVKDGWRLLEKEEIGVWNNPVGRPLAESAMNHTDGRRWSERTGPVKGWLASAIEVCYRTKKPVGHFLPPAKRVALTLEEFPPICWFRLSGDSSKRFLLIGVDRGMVENHVGDLVSMERLADSYEYSVDLKTWKPCYKEVQS